MRKLSVLMLTCCMNVFVYAQNDDDGKLLRQEADRYFNLEQFDLSIDYYTQAKATDVQAIFRLAESYRRTFNYQKAEDHYNQVLSLDAAAYPLSGYYHGLMQKLNGKYEESIRSFDEFIKRNKNNNAVLQFVEQALIDRAGSEAALDESNSKSNRYTLLIETLNSPANDYAPAAADTSRLIITSGRMKTSLSAVDGRYGESFTDNFYFEKSNGKWVDHTQRNIRNLNSRYNDGSGAFNLKGDRYYFTMCGKEGSECRIVVSKLRNGKWSNPKQLNGNINPENVETKHPAVSPGGDTLMFATDRPGGHGGFDIWMSINSGDDDWGPAINMGDGINTRMNEAAPSFTEFNHVFFFASEGHQGFGGMDLYMGKRFSDGSRAVYNLGYPFNSNRDDCFISFSANRLYISSNREGGAGGFDIYSASIKSPLSFVSRLSLKHRAGREVVLASLRNEGSWLDIFSSRKEDRIEYEDLTYEKKKIVDRMIADNQQKKQNSVADFKGISKEEFDNLSAIASSQFYKIELRHRYKKALLNGITSHGDQSIAINGVLMDSTTGRPLGSTNVFLMNEKGEVLKVTSTNEDGIFRFTNTPGGEHLFLRIQDEYTGKMKAYINDLVVVDDTPETFTFENIYFDTDHYDLRIEAKDVLNKLGEFLKLVPDSQVEIFAYADDRGTDTYNFTLSKRRGEEVLKYLGSIGVDETSIAIVAKGRQLQHDDLNNDEKRQFNRRVEFYINGQRSSALVTADRNK